MPKKPKENSTIDRQRSKINIKCDENTTFILMGQEITQMYRTKLQVK